MTATLDLPASVLVKDQKKRFGPKVYQIGRDTYRITTHVRYDDQCGNGHNTFSITADIDRKVGNRWMEDSGGCCHDEVAKHFPELAPFIKWHLVSSNGPMHYVANTIYHATEHGSTSAWVYWQDPANGIGEQCVKYCDIAEAKKICESSNNYTMKIDQKTLKIANLDHARSSAVWPEATQEQLLDKDTLLARLPALMAEFKTAVESLGFVY